MKPAGIVRRVDQLGRIVLPKSLRKRFKMNEGDPVEILVQGDHIILERYHPRCVFCGSIDNVLEFKERHICSACLKEMHPTGSGAGAESELEKATSTGQME